MYRGEKARDESVGVNRDLWETFTLQDVQKHFLKVPKVKLKCLIFQTAKQKYWSFPNRSPEHSHWSPKQIAPPQTHSIGLACCCASLVRITNKCFDNTTETINFNLRKNLLTNFTLSEIRVFYHLRNYTLKLKWFWGEEWTKRNHCPSFLIITLCCSI